MTTALDIQSRLIWDSLALQLRDKRLSCEGISQVDLAKTLDISINTMFRWEARRKVPTLPNFVVWYSSLGFRLAVFEKLGGEAERPEVAEVEDDPVARELARIFATLRAARRERKVTQGRLASVLGLALSSVRRWEDGSGLPRPLMLIKWATALNCSLKLVPAAS